MVAWADAVTLAEVSVLALLVAGTAAVLVLYRLDDADWGGRLRRRFVLGVPWGTAIAVAVVLAVYLFVQGAWSSLRDPLVVPFRSWSYGYPLGIVTASFAHGSLGHVTGNLLSTVVFAPVAEYAWSHYPTARGSKSFASPGSHPFVRIGLFVAGVLLVGLAGSLLVPGPVIGFSGVVFAFAGFALVTRPLLAIAAIVAVRVVGVAYAAVLEPVAVFRVRPELAEPGFAGVAVQGHAFGLLVGVVLGAIVVWRRGSAPPARHVWLATLVFAVSQSLYALYWYAGANAYQLFRGAGMAVVFVLVALVVAAVAAGDRTPVPRSRLTPRHLAAGFLLAIVLGIGLAAVPFNLADVAAPDPGDGLEVRDYTVTYAEDVEHGYAAAVELPLIGGSLAERARASGVILASDRRNAWEEVVSAQRLAFDGRATVAVGGLGWRERVVANRTEWNAVDAGATYKVFLRRADEPRRLAHASDPVALAPRIAGYNLSIEPTEAGYALNATRDGATVDRVPVPGANESVSVGDVRVERRGEDLFASHDGTRVRVAEYHNAGRAER